MREKVKKEILKILSISNDIEPIRNSEISINLNGEMLSGQILSVRQNSFGIKEFATSLSLSDILPFDRNGRRKIIKRIVKQENKTFFITVSSTNTEESVGEFFIGESKKFSKRRQLTLPPLKNGLKLFYYLADKLKHEGFIDKKNNLPFVLVSMFELRKLLPGMKKSDIKKLLLEMNFTSISIVAQIREGNRTITEDIIKGVHLISLKTVDKSLGEEHYPYITVYINPKFLAILGINRNLWLSEDYLEKLNPIEIELFLLIKRWSKKSEFRIRAKDLFERLDVSKDSALFSRNVQRICSALDSLKDIGIISDWKYFTSSSTFLIKK